MPMIPGLSNVEVFFGDTEKPLPEWRPHADKMDEADPDDVTPEERKSVANRLGFDPNEGK